MTISSEGREFRDIEADYYTYPVYTGPKCQVEWWSYSSYFTHCYGDNPCEGADDDS